MKFANKILLVILCIIGGTVIGLSIYFTSLYFNRDSNERFESAYIYDTNKNSEVYVDLGSISGGEKIEQNIKVVSRISKKVKVNFEFKGEKDSLGNYLKIHYLDETPLTLNENIEGEINYSFELEKEESKEIKLVYELMDVSDLPTGSSLNFKIDIVAVDIPYISF